MEDPTAELTREDLASEAPPLHTRVRVSVGCKTDLGRVRENNEDKFEFYVPDDESTLARRGMVFVVCDGMGGHAAGQIASELACKTFIDVFFNHSIPEPADAARHAVVAANRFVQNSAMVPGRRGMGTTLSALILHQEHAIVVHVGDSRVYRLRDGALTQLSTDHTFVEEQVRAGAMTRETAAQSAYAHALMRAVGADGELEPDIDTFDLALGDVYLLCSDGVTSHAGDDVIAEMLRLPPSEAAWRLVNYALADGGSDNCTTLVVRVESIERFDE